MKIDFSPPFITPESKRLVNEVLDSGWITSGPVMLKLEESLGHYLQRPCLTFNSWTSAAIILLNRLSNKALARKYVVIPNYTYVATYNAVIHAGLVPLVLDVDDNFIIDKNILEKTIAKYSREILAVMIVEFGGIIPDYESFRAIIKNQSSDIVLIGDAAHSFGSQYHGETSRILEFDCDFLIYSMHAVKNLTSAEGGFIAFNRRTNKDFIENIRLARLNFQTKSALEKNKSGQWEYDIMDIGFKANLPDVLAAIALGQIPSYQGVLNQRYKIAEFYTGLFEDVHWAKPPALVSSTFVSNCHLYPLRITNPSIRTELMRFLESNEIAYNVHFKPISLMSFFKGSSYLDYPQSVNIFHQEISLPIHHKINKNELDYLESKLAYFIKRHE